jgi:hypothetical protein
MSAFSPNIIKTYSSRFATRPISVYLHDLSAYVLNKLTALPKLIHCKYAVDIGGESGSPLVKVVCLRNEIKSAGRRNVKKVKLSL